MKKTIVLILICVPLLLKSNSITVLVNGEEESSKCVTVRDLHFTSHKVTNLESPHNGWGRTTLFYDTSLQPENAPITAGEELWMVLKPLMDYPKDVKVYLKNKALVLEGVLSVYYDN